jgi:uncharacterized repeat protein (TIGR03803 family)
VLCPAGGDGAAKVRPSKRLRQKPADVNCDDGKMPSGKLTIDASGNLYGTTYYGGEDANLEGGAGVVFKLTRNADKTWAETVLNCELRADGRSIPSSQFHPVRCANDVAVCAGPALNRARTFELLHEVPPCSQNDGTTAVVRRRRIGLSCGVGRQSAGENSVSTDRRRVQQFVVAVTRGSKSQGLRSRSWFCVAVCVVIS